MTKQELITVLATCPEIGTKKKADAILSFLTATIGTELTAGNIVTLGTDFGTFKPVTRTGKAPGTGTPYTSTSIKFSVSAPFKRALNNK